MTVKWLLLLPFFHTHPALKSSFSQLSVLICAFCPHCPPGKKFENTEMFGQYPLQVNGFKDLHECLEAAMIEGEIESLHSAENSARSGQEVSDTFRRNLPMKSETYTSNN